MGERFCVRFQSWIENQYSDLSTAILGGEGIDFFPIGSLGYYINGIVNGMFQPVDEYVDFNSELWSNVKNANGGIISKFPIKCYIDDPGDWVTNENAIYWNAVMVFYTAILA